MGNLMGSLRYKEPRTVEECDSTWESDSESDEQPGDEDSGISECVSRFETGRCGEQANMSPKVNRLPTNWHTEKQPHTNTIGRRVDCNELN